MICGICSLGVLFFAPLAHSVVRIEKSLDPVPVVISGTLHPFAIALNGEPLESIHGSCKALLLNGKKLALTPGPEKAFYVSTGDDEIDLKAVDPQGHSKSILKMHLPRIRSIEVGREKVSFHLEGTVGGMTLDGKQVNASGRDPAAADEWPIPADRRWIERPHVVELKSGSGLGRLYNLNFSEWRSALLREFWIGIGPMDPMIEEGSGGIGITLWHSWENRLAAGLSLAFSESNQSGTDPVYQTQWSSRILSYGLRLRVGAYPFLPGQSWLDFKRFIPGVFVSYGRGLEMHSNTYQFNGSTRHDDSENGIHAWTGGIFFQEEPIRWRSFGLSLMFDFVLIRPYSSGSVRPTANLTYHF